MKRLILHEPIIESQNLSVSNRLSVLTAQISLISLQVVLIVHIYCVIVISLVLFTIFTFVISIISIPYLLKKLNWSLYLSILNRKMIFIYQFWSPAINLLIIYIQIEDDEWRLYYELANWSSWINNATIKFI